MNLYRSIALLAIGYAIVATLCCFTGLVIYATFYDCDPLITKVERLQPTLILIFNDVDQIAYFSYAGDTKSGSTSSIICNEDCRKYTRTHWHIFIWRIQRFSQVTMLKGFECYRKIILSRLIQ